MGQLTSRDPIIDYAIVIAGLRVAYDLERVPGDRVVSVMVLCSNCSVPQYETLAKDQKYLIILNDYLLRGGDKFDTFRTSCMDAKCFSKWLNINSIILSRTFATCT